MRKILKIESSIIKLSFKKRVAAYARVSSDKDVSLHSLSAQISYYSAYIQKHKAWEYAGVYADKAITGTKDNRPEFQRLMDDCRNGRIDMVITKSISRFARNTVDLLEKVRELKGLGIDVYFEKENIHSKSNDGELMLTILASFAQEESRSVSENVKWRIRKRFQRGELVNLRFIYGYRIENGRVGINPNQAEIVKMIFNDYIKGMGGGEIANKLKDMEVPTLLGGEWNGERVIAILKNEKYTGNALLQKRYVADYLTKKLVPNRGELPRYFAKGTHPPIIKHETFQKVQEIITKKLKPHHKRSTHKRYPFTGIILCKNCGKKYKRKSNGKKASWQCSTYLEKGKKACYTKQIPESTLIQVTKEVLRLSEFDEEAFRKNIKRVEVPEFNRLDFILHDGHKVEASWKDHSRRESCTKEMRQKARERQLERSRKDE